MNSLAISSLCGRKAPGRNDEMTKLEVQNQSGSARVLSGRSSEFWVHFLPPIAPNVSLNQWARFLPEVLRQYVMSQYMVLRGERS